MWADAQSTTITGSLRAVAARTPDATALRTLDGDLTFAALMARVDGLAAGLRERGAQTDTLVGIHLERSPDMIVAILGVLASGAGYVPLDPHHPQPHLRGIVADSGLSILLSSADGDALCAGTGAERWDPAAWPAHGAPSPEPAEGIAYLIYTSGSTGAPKGVVIERAALRNYLVWCDIALPFTGGGAPLFATIAFDHAVTSLFPPLLRGEPLTLLPPIRGGRGLADGLLTGHRYSYVKITPSHLRMLDRDQRAELGRSAGVVMFGGERVTSDLVGDVRRDAPELAVINHYGPTETTVGCCAYSVPPWFAGANVPIGTPLIGVYATVRRADGSLCDGDEEGELYIGGRGLAREYWHRPDLTARAFVHAPDEHGNRRRWYRTGDLVVRRPDGLLEYLGRLDDQVKILGHRIEPAEVESVLRAHSAVRDAVVVASKRGTAVELVAAVVATDAAPSAEELRRFARARIPAAMIPSRVVFFEQLPVDHNGKVDRRAIEREQALREHERELETSLEQSLAAKWRDVLGAETQGYDDDFFELGGDSMATVELSAWAAERFGVPLEPTALFDHPTIRSLADRIRSLQADVDGPAT
jgi:amino acid adenylation domain-containing protein